MSTLRLDESFTRSVSCMTISSSPLIVYLILMLACRRMTEALVILLFAILLVFELMF